MASRLGWLQTCKLKQLEAIARATGINSSGTKPTLITQIQDGLSHITLPRPGKIFSSKKESALVANHGYSVFSIDMGIRNLAYCQLVLPPTWLQRNPNNPQSIRPVIPRLLRWSRIDVSKPVDDIQASNDSALITESPAKESFSPSIYASHAHTFLATHILPHAPTHILIERQRFRSMGGSAVQEWTLRVNMFEAMLYATLRTYSELGMWKGEVVPVLPSKVVKYWLDGRDDVVEMDREKTRRKSLSGKNSKMLKMGIVRDMVEHGTGVIMDGEAKETAGLVMKRGSGKFDDLADCLLQGLAWVKWEENKRLVWEKGLGVLDELENQKEKGEG
ncbi:MAG: hypothetical protein Q9209_003952 [Squamulea sp. 1 TL-2023]